MNLIKIWLLANIILLAVIYTVPRDRRCSTKIEVIEALMPARLVSCWIMGED